MYATAPKTQLRPEPGTPGESGFGNFATLQINSVQQKHNRKTLQANSLEQDVGGIEIEERLKRYMCENQDGE